MAHVTGQTGLAVLVTQTSEYALRAVVHLAQIGGGPQVAQEISEATLVPVGYLHKILRLLARDGILTAQRGVGGGFSLAREASDIDVLEILRATDTAIARIDGCPLGIPGHTELCSVHKLLDDVIAYAEERFSQTTVEDLLRREGPSEPLCDTEGARNKAKLKVSAGRGRSGGAGAAPKSKKNLSR